MAKELTASEMARRRWKGTTKIERQEAMKRASLARMTTLTPEERSEIARKAVSARWAKAKAKTKP